jgi:hypothetical protein
MDTSGGGNDWVMTVVPLGVMAIIAVYFAGGPTNALQFLDDTIRTIVYRAAEFVNAWL